MRGVPAKLPLLALLFPTVVSATQFRELSISTGFVFPSAADAVRTNASILPFRDASSGELLVGLPGNNGESLRGIGAVSFKTDNAGIGLALEYWNPQAVYRGSLGYRFLSGRTFYSLGAAVQVAQQATEQEDTTSIQPTSSVVDANLSASIYNQGFRGTLILQSIRNRFDTIIGGFGYSDGMIFWEVDAQWIRNSYNDIFILPGIGFRGPNFTAAVRYYWTLASEEVGGPRELSAGELSVGAGYQFNYRLLIKAIYKYDPNTFNVGLVYRL